MAIRLTTEFRNVLNKLYRIDIHDKEMVPLSFEVVYGFLYNWPAATDARLICADGWEVPTAIQSNALRNYNSDWLINGGYFKEAGISYWDAPNTGASNIYGFNARGGGNRQGVDGIFNSSIKRSMIFHTIDDYDGVSGYGMSLTYNSAMATSHVASKKDAYSIRLVKTTTTLTHGQTGTYTGNDGKVYRTICIGTQEWLADNLAETKYRNGDYIIGFNAGVYTPIDDADWAALSVGALCAYDDDVDNAYTGVYDPAIEYIAARPGFNLSYQTGGGDILHTPIIGSSVEIFIQVTTAIWPDIEDLLQDIVSSDESRFTVLIYEDSAIYWRGKIQIERVQIPDSQFPQIQLFAADGLGRLDSIPYTNGEIFYYDYETLQNHFHNIISKLDLYSILPGNELGIVQDWTVTALSGRFPESIQVQHDAFKENKGTKTFAFNCLDVLKQLLTRFDLRIVQQSGIFYIEQVGYLAGDGYKTCHYYDSAGDFVETTSNTTFNRAKLQKLAGGLTFYREPAKDVTVQYAFKNGITSNIFSGDNLVANSAFTDGEIPMENGEMFGFAFDYFMDNTPPDPYQPNTFYFVAFVYTIQIGTYYLSNDGGVLAWSTNSANRVTIYSRQIDINETAVFIQPIGMICPVAPETGTLVFTWNVDFVDLDYNSFPSVNCAVNIARQVGLIVYGVDQPSEGTNVTVASVGNTSGEKIEIDVLITGDKPYGASVGRIKKYNGTAWIDTFEDWGFNAVESLNIDELLAREIIATQQKAVKMQSLKIYDDVNVAFKIDGSIIMNASYNAQENQWSLEAFVPEILRTGVTFTYYQESESAGGLPDGITTPPTSGSVNFWQRNNAVLSPVASGDELLVQSIEVIANQAGGYSLITADEALTSEFNVLVDTTTDDVIVTLPDAESCANRIYTIRMYTGTNTVIITPVNYNSIKGSLASYATLILDAPGEWVTIQSDGTDWYVIKDNPTF